MLDIVKVFSPAAVAANWTEVQSNKIPALGAGLFPNKKKAGLDLSWIRGSKGLAVSLMPSAFDAQATFRDRAGFKKTETEMPFFREGYRIKERDRQELLRVSESKDPYAQEVIAHIYDDVNDLIAGADVVAERMRMQLLFPDSGNMGITFSGKNGVNYTYNYDAASAWKGTNYTALTTSDLWSAPTTADPFKQFTTVKNAILAATGTELRTAVMNSATFNYLCAVDAVKNRYLTTNGIALGYLTNTEVAAVIRGTVGLDIVLYDKQYKDEAGVAHTYVPDGYVALLPEGAIGSTWYGTTPEEADGRAAGADVSIVNTGVAITHVYNQHPVTHDIFASEIVLPSFERMDEVALMKVL